MHLHPHPHITALALDRIAFSNHRVRSVQEVPERIAVIHNAISRAGLLSRTLPVPVPDLDNPEDLDATMYWIRRHHSGEYIEALKNACASAHLNPHKAIMSGRTDAEISPGTYDATIRGTGVMLRAAEMVMQGHIQNAFCAIRPPGHHAMPDAATGFCFVNHVGVTARYLMEHHQLSRILIIDWDLHHGNGAQASFWDDPRVLFCSLHGDPRQLRYPGTGAANETGKYNNIINIPLPYDTDSEAYQLAIKERFLDSAYAFRPEFVLISAGFDTHKDDTFDFMRLETGMFAWLTRELKKVAAHSAGRRLVSVLEGGYNLNVLGESVVAHVEELSVSD